MGFLKGSILTSSLPAGVTITRPMLASDPRRSCFPQPHSWVGTCCFVCAVTLGHMRFKLQSQLTTYGLTCGQELAEQAGLSDRFYTFGVCQLRRCLRHVCKWIVVQPIWESCISTPTPIICLQATFCVSKCNLLCGRDVNCLGCFWMTI